MAKYDGWVIKNKEGNLIIWSFQETEGTIIRKLECVYDDHWGTLEKKYGFKLVKVKLVEVE